jgi:hypothetical protein
VSPQTRTRRKKAGLANLHYLRHGRFFVLLATHGTHAFFTEEAGQIHDARRRPITFHGYALSYRNGHPHVRMALGSYRHLKARLLAQALQQSAEALAATFYSVPFEPYAPVRRQLLNLLRAVNRVRKRAGLSRVPSSCLHLRRRIYRPFAGEAYPLASAEHAA